MQRPWLFTSVLVEYVHAAGEENGLATEGGGKGELSLDTLLPGTPPRALNLEVRDQDDSLELRKELDIGAAEVGEPESDSDSPDIGVAKQKLQKILALLKDELSTLDSDLKEAAGSSGASSLTVSDIAAAGAAEYEGVSIAGAMPDVAATQGLGADLGSLLYILGGVALLGAAAGGGGGGGGGGGSSVDTTVPSVTGITYGSHEGALAKGESVTLNVKFSENVVLNGAVSLSLANGGMASYVSGSGSDTLVFSYTPLVGQGTSDLATADANALVGTIQDLAGNSADLSGANGKNPDGVLAVDVASPNIVGMVVERKDNVGEPLDAPKLYLVFDEPLDAANLPGADAFSVFTVINGTRQENTVTTVSVSGNTVTLTLGSKFEAGQVDVNYTDPSTADDENALQDVAGNDATSFYSGQVVDGYIRGAAIWIDTDGDGVKDVDTGVVTNADGNFFLPADTPSGAIVAVGGVNVDTGLPNTTELKAPAGSSTINPLTTLVQAMVESGAVADAGEASALLASSLGLPPGTDLTSYDPYAALRDGDPNSDAYQEALAAQHAAAQLVAIVELADDPLAVENLAKLIVESAGSPVDFSDGATLSVALDGVSVDPATQSLIADAVEAIGKTSSLGDLSNTQSQFLDKLPPATPVVETAGYSSDTSPVLRIQIETKDTGGSAAVVGDTLAVIIDGVQVGTAQVTSADIANGYIDYTVQTALQEGSHQLSAQLIDKSGNASGMATETVLVIDQTPPSVSISTSADQLVSGQKATLTFSFSEPVADFLADDIQIPTGAILGALSGPETINGFTVYTAEYTAVSGDNTVSIAADSYVDLTGNSGAASNTLNLAAANPPVVVIASLGGTDKVVSSLSGDQVLKGVAHPDGTVVLSTGTWTSTAITVASDGGWTYSLSADDLALIGQGNNFSLTASQTVNDLQGQAVTSFAVDTLAPTFTVNTPVNLDINAADKAAGVTLTGTAELGASVHLEIGGTLRALTVSDNGSWSYTLTSADYKAMGEGAETVSMVAMDAYGNTSATQTVSLNVDTAPPVVTGFELAKDSQTGASILSNAITAHVTPALTFMAEAGVTPTVSVNGVEISGTLSTGDSTADGDVRYTFVPDQPLGADGVYKLQLAVTDASGNTTVRNTSITVDTKEPVLTPIEQPSAVENQSILYHAQVDNPAGITWWLSGQNADLLQVNSLGVVSVKTGVLDYETQPAWSFTLTATDAAGNVSSPLNVEVTISNIDEVAPTFISDISVSVANGLVSGTVVYDANAIDTEFNTPNTADSITYSLANTGDYQQFSIDPASGAVTLNESPNYYSKPTYVFTIVATDAAGNANQQIVDLVVQLPAGASNVAPIITSGTSVTVSENAAVGADLYHVTAVDPNAGDTLTYRIAAGNEAGNFTINENTGVISLAAGGALDYETAPSYSLTLEVTDQGGLSATSTVTLSVKNLDELAPTIT